MSDIKFKELASSIKKDGLKEPITWFDRMILDGKCRWLACLLTGVTPVHERYDGDAPLQFLIDKNLHRLSVSQRAMIAAKICTPLEDSYLLSENSCARRCSELIDLAKKEQEAGI